MIKAAIIGGTGHESPDYLKDPREISIETPFGKPYPLLYTGFLNGNEVYHLVRHGREQGFPPSIVNYRANMYALKELGCNYIFATTTCGSLQEEICPGEFIILDQFIDMTKQRISGIYEDLQPDEGNYFSMAEPFSDELRDHLIEAAIIEGITVHTKGNILSIDGLRSTSRAESNLYRSWGADVINMSTAPEVILANELGIPFAEVALCTRYDSWRISDTSPDGESIRKLAENNREKVIRLISYALRKIEQ